MKTVGMHEAQDARCCKLIREISKCVRSCHKLVCTCGVPSSALRLRHVGRNENDHCEKDPLSALASRDEAPTVTAKAPVTLLHAWVVASQMDVSNVFISSAKLGGDTLGFGPQTINEFPCTFKRLKR